VEILVYLEGPDYKSVPAGLDFAPLLAPICNRCQKRPVRITSLFFLEGTNYKTAPAGFVEPFAGADLQSVPKKTCKN